MESSVEQKQIEFLEILYQMQLNDIAFAVENGFVYSMEYLKQQAATTKLVLDNLKKMEMIKVGDKIRVTTNSFVMSPYEHGTIHTVKEIHPWLSAFTGNGIKVDDTTFMFHTSEVEKVDG